MTREQWKLQYRAERLLRPKSTVDVGALLKELYDYYYTDRQWAFVRLYTRYKAKLPAKYVKKYNKIRNLGKKASSEYMKDLFYKNNPFLALLPKQGDFVDKHASVPITYGDDK